MKRLLNLIIIVLVISLPFIPIADILIPKGVHLEDQILSIILLIPIIKIIVCLVLIISHKAYNSNKQGWILFTIGLFAILPLYLEISILKSTQHTPLILTYIKQTCLLFSLITLLLITIRTLNSLKTELGKLTFGILCCVIIYHIWDNINELIVIYNASKPNIETSDIITKLVKPIRIDTSLNALLYLIPIYIGLFYVYRGRIRIWKFNAVLAFCILGIVLSLPNIIINKNIVNTIFTSTAVALMPSYFLGIIMLTKSARKLR
jgi:hypothetical protein